MAQTLTTAAASKVNRRFLLLALILAALAAVLAYAAISQSGGGSEGAAGDVPVVVAKRAIVPGTRITEDMVEVKQLEADGVGLGTLSELEDVVGQVTRYPLEEGEHILYSKLVGARLSSNDALSYVLEEGLRGMAINVQEVVSVGGLVLPGDRVDVIWVPAKGAPGYILMTDLEVSAVSQTIVDVAPAAPGALQTPTSSQEEPQNERLRASDADPNPQAITATLMVSPEQAATLLCAENMALKFDGFLRLAVRAFGDHGTVAPNAPPCGPETILAIQAALGGQ